MMYESPIILQLQRIADAIEEQNRLYVEQRIKADERDDAYEQRRFLHDFELVEANHAQRTEQLKIEQETIRDIQKLYDTHPELAKMHALVLESSVIEQRLVP